MKEKYYPYKLEGYYTDYIWGGDKLKKYWNKNTPQPIIAESWEFSLYLDKESTIINGALKGKNLRELFSENPEIFGSNLCSIKDFPLLIKLIDATKDLSVQVHPSDDYAIKYENQFGKTEMWYIADAEADASIYFGLKQSVSKEELARRIEDNTIEQLLNEVKVQAGDCFFIESGTLHAIKAGVTVIEIQQNSNLTYRVYDYNRVDNNGNSRELHIEKAIEVANIEKTEIRNANYSDIEYNTLTNMSGCIYFIVDFAKVIGSFELLNNQSFLALTIAEGSGQVNNVDFEKGDTFMIPCAYKAKIESESAIVIVTSV